MSESGTEIYFYHLERRSLEDVLPTLLERSLERGWRAAVQAASEERVEALNTLLSRGELPTARHCARRLAGGASNLPHRDGGQSERRPRPFSGRRRRS